MQLTELENSVFPIIFKVDLLDELSNKSQYDFFHVSIFDHWLTEDECLTEIILFSELENADNKLFFEYEERFYDAFRELFYKYQILLFDTDYEQDCPPINFYRFDNEQEFRGICLLNIRELKLFTLCFPHEGIIIMGGYDLTNLVFFKKTIDPKVKEDILRIFINNGLFILEQ